MENVLFENDYALCGLPLELTHHRQEIDLFDEEHSLLLLFLVVTSLAVGVFGQNGGFSSNLDYSHGSQCEKHQVAQQKHADGSSKVR